MFSVVNRVAHYELGFADADRLVVLWSTDAERGVSQQPPTWEFVQALLAHGGSFEAFGLFQGGGAPVTLASATESSRVSQMPVDVNALSIVGVAPLLGRTYRPEDFADVVKQKEARSIVVSYDTWQRRLGATPDVIGTSIRVDGEPRTVIGVMPRGFALVPWADDIAFWAANDLSRIPQARWMTAVGRLKAGVSLASAQAEATAISRQMIVPIGFPELLRHIPIDARVLGFALAISVASSLVFGLLPALQASRVDLNEVLKEGGRGSSGAHRRGRSVLLVVEVALSMVLLVGAGLMMRGFLREQSDLPGFETKGLLTADILLGGTKYFDKTPQDMNLVTPQSEMFFDQLLERVRALPGVTRAGISSRLPMQVWTHPFAIVGKPTSEPGHEPRADLNEVDSQLLDTLGIRRLPGRLTGH